MMSGNFGFMGGSMWIYWIALIVGIIFLLRWIVQQSKPIEQRSNEDPLELLKKRYVNGEIEQDEYMKRRKNLLS